MTELRYQIATCLLLGIMLTPGCHKQTPPVPLPATPAPAGVPHLDARQTTYQAGDIDFGKTRECPFTIRNTGNGTLRLTLRRRYCDCAEVQVPAEIAPGAEEAVVVRWTPIPGKTGPYTMTAELKTNDPQKPILTLKVEATVNPLIRVWPEDCSYVDFSRIAPGKRTKRVLNVFSTKLEAFDLGVATTSPGLFVAKEKLPANTTVGNGPARSGYSVTITISRDSTAGILA